MDWNGCAKSDGKLRRNAVMIFTPSTNVIAPRQRAFLIGAIEVILHRSESNQRVLRMAEPILPITGASMANAAQKLVQAVG